jgi:hypothetical protein
MTGWIRVLTAAAVVSVAPALAGCAYAQYGSYGPGVSRPAVSPYEVGYREGREHGIRDARRGRRFEFRDSSDYRRADRGWNGWYGDQAAYRHEFRRGYERGYSAGYSSIYGRATYPGRAYPGAYPGVGSPGGTYRSSAADYGYREGFDKGREDAGDGDRYDPRRHKWYREGDRHYNSRYGPRDLWKDEYRRAFLQGYDAGYRRGW